MIAEFSERTQIKIGCPLSLNSFAVFPGRDAPNTTRCCSPEGTTFVTSSRKPNFADNAFELLLKPIRPSALLDHLRALGEDDCFASWFDSLPHREADSSHRANKPE